MDDNPASTCCATSRNKNSSYRKLERQTLHQPTSENEPPLGMVLIPRGAFIMGSDDESGYPADGEGPSRHVKLDSFFMDAYSVTNARFGDFVRDTGYVSEAERYGWSFVFHSFVPRSVAKSVQQSPLATPWWWVVQMADWRHPEGPGSNINKRKSHPVVHISWNDAVAYSNWAGKRLPTESEWEYAARGGLIQKTYPWGDDICVGGKHLCNIWQGDFPDHNTQQDGYVGTAPVKSFKPNHYGLYNMVGNVWEWCSDWFSSDHSIVEINENPKGPPRGTNKCMRGGSYLCHESYCNRYRVAARSSNTPDSSTGNLGFRCVKESSANPYRGSNNRST